MWPETPTWKPVTAVLVGALVYAAFLTWQIHHTNATEQKLTEQARALRVRADQGNGDAEYQLALLYHQGNGVPQDYAEALRWYLKAADQGDARAQYGIGYMNELGQGVPQDYTEALRLYNKAADRGETKAEYAIGSMYYNGRGIQQDRTEAVRWYRKAAEGNLARAQYDLGYMYYYGEGVPQDRAEAVRWYQKAADHGDEYAQRVLHIKWKGMSKFFKITLSIMLVGNVLILAGAVKDWRSPRSAQQRIFGIAGLFGWSYLALDLLGFRYIGILTPLAVVGAFSLVKTLLSGAFVALLLSAIFPTDVWPKVAKLLLALNGLLLIALDARVLANDKLRSAAPALRPFWTLNGMLLGFSIVLAIIIWRTNKGRKEDPTETAGLPPTIPSPS